MDIPLLTDSKITSDIHTVSQCNIDDVAVFLKERYLTVDIY